MFAYYNGRILPESEARVSLSDRGLLYGDGLFETIRVLKGQPVWWDRHWQRLQEGAGFLRLPIPWSQADLRLSAGELIRRNEVDEGVLRLRVSRGEGARGYSPRGAGAPHLALTLHPLPVPPPTLNAVYASLRLLGGDPLLRHKTSNRLVSVLARAEADERGADEAILLNHEGGLVEGSAGNLFWISGERLLTPPVSSGALPGVARSVLMEVAVREGRAVTERAALPRELAAASGIFLTNSVSGVLPIHRLEGAPVPLSPQIADWKRWLDAAMGG